MLAPNRSRGAPSARTEQPRALHGAPSFPPRARARLPTPPEPYAHASDLSASAGRRRGVRGAVCYNASMYSTYIAAVQTREVYTKQLFRKSWSVAAREAAHWPAGSAAVSARSACVFHTSNGLNAAGAGVTGAVSVSKRLVDDTSAAGVGVAGVALIAPKGSAEAGAAGAGAAIPPVSAHGEKGEAFVGAGAAGAG